LRPTGTIRLDRDLPAQKWLRAISVTGIDGPLVVGLLPLADKKRLRMPY
jgi:hypothetical protein